MGFLKDHTRIIMESKCQDQISIAKGSHQDLEEIMMGMWWEQTGTITGL